MIESFRCKDTRALFENKRVARFVSFEQVARRKLKQLHAAADLAFLKVPPQNRLEALKGDRKGQWSIRINDQWRLCFEWRDGSALNVEIVDSH
ncbi:MAG: type II toxin-antitoxin system RelE/ParE family toxin [Thiobacillus sp.]